MELEFIRRNKKYLKRNERFKEWYQRTKQKKKRTETSHNQKRAMNFSSHLFRFCLFHFFFFKQIFSFVLFALFYDVRYKKNIENFRALGRDSSFLVVNISDENTLALSYSYCMTLIIY